MKKTTKKLTEFQKEYNNIVNKYLLRFVKKHGYEFSDWISDVGEIACFIEQYFLNFDDIRYDIDNNIKKGLIFQWQDDGIEHAMKHNYGYKDNINFKSYISGLRYEDLEKLNNITVLKSKTTLELVVKSNSGLDMTNLVERKYPYCKIISKVNVVDIGLTGEQEYSQNFKIKIKE